MMSNDELVPIPLSDQLDLYCERCSPEFWAEPINALSNGAFVLAAIAAAILAYRERKLTLPHLVMMALAVTIGIGSFLFHTFATRSTMWMDLVPIFLFQLWFLWLYGRRFWGLRADTAAALVAGFFAAMMAARLFPHAWLNGSLTYLPAFLMLLFVGVTHAQRNVRGRWLLLAGAGVFTLALVFRSLDIPLCGYLPLGTHFLWHLCNGVLIYLTMQALLVGSPVTTNKTLDKIVTN